MLVPFRLSPWEVPSPNVASKTRASAIAAPGGRARGQAARWNSWGSFLGNWTRCRWDRIKLGSRARDPRKLMGFGAMDFNTIFFDMIWVWVINFARVFFGG